MQPVIKYISEFYRKGFKLFYFLLILLMVGSLICLNYGHGLEADLVNGGSTWLSHFTGYYLLYFIPFTIAFLLQLFFFKDCSYFKNPWFWAILFLAPAFFSFRVNFSLHELLINKIWSGDEARFFIHSLGWVVRVFVVLGVFFEQSCLSV